MKYMLAFPLLWTAAVLQSGAATGLAVDGVAPNYLLLLLITVIFTVDGWPSLVLAAAMGLVSDCLSPGRLGIDLLCYTLTALCVRRLIGKRPQGGILSLSVVGALTVFTALLLSTTARILFSGRSVDAGEMTFTLIGTAAFTTALGVLILLTVRLAARRWNKSGAFSVKRRTPQASGWA